MEVFKSQTNIGSEKNFGSEKNDGSEEILGQQKLLSIKTFGPKKNLSLQKMLKKVLDSKKYVEKYFQCEKTLLGLKNVWVCKVFESETISGPQILGPKKF